MALSDCIRKVNDNPNLPSFSENEMKMIKGFKENYKDKDPEIAERLAIRDYALTVNDGLNFIKEAVGEGKQQFDDSYTIPDRKIPTENIEPKSQDEIDSEFKELFSEITSGKSEEYKNLVESGVRAIGKGATRTEKILFDNEVSRATSKITGSTRKFINDYLDKPASVVTKGIVKGAKSAGDWAGRGTAKAENSALKSIEKFSGKEIKSQVTANGMIRDAIDSFLPNVNLSDSQQKTKRGFTGEKEMGKEMTGRLVIGLKSHPAYNYDSMERIHQVMDPEASQNVVGPAPELAKYEDLSEAEREMHDYLRSINNYIHETNYSKGLIDEETYNRFKGNYIARMYEEIEMAEVESDFKSGAIDTNIYKARKELSDQMQSVRDPLFLTMKRFGQTMQNVAVADYINAIAADPENSLTAEEFENLEKTEKSKYTKLTVDSKGKRFGQLEGKYVLNTYVEDLKNQQFLSKYMNDFHSLVSLYDRNIFRQMTKQGLTVFNPATRLVNIISGFHFANLAGVDGISFARNRVAAKEDFASGITEDIEHLFRSGVLSMSNIEHELSPSKSDDKTGHQEETGAELISPISEEAKNETFTGGILRVGKAAKDNYESISKMARRSYGRSDDVAKLAAYKSLIEQGFSKEEATDKVAKAMQNYSSVGKAYSLGAKIPFIGNAFVRFQADLLRISANAMIDKPVTTAMYVGSIYALSRLTSYLSGEDDEERLIRTDRPFTPDMFGIPLMWKVGDMEVNMAKFMTPYYTYDLGARDEGTFNTKFLPFDLTFKDGGFHLRSGDPTLGWVVDLGRNKDFRSKSITNPDGNALDEKDARMNQFIYAMRNSIGNAVPIRLLHDMYLYDRDGQDYYGRNRDISTTLMSRVIKIQEWEDSKYKDQVIDYFYYKDRDIDNLVSERKSFERDYERKVAEISRMNISDGDKEKRINKATDDYVEIMMESYEKEVKLNTEKVEFAEKIPVTLNELAED